MTGDPYRTAARSYDLLVEPLNAPLRRIGLSIHPPQPGMRVLDVGCGTGTHLVLYRDAGCHVTGIDTSPAMLRVAREKLGVDADLHTGDATRMPFADGSFDLVLGTLALHEMRPAVRTGVAAEMARVLAPDGRILLIDYRPGSLRFPKGWMYKVIISVLEVTAGREHFRNYRNFMATGGVPGLLDSAPVSIEKSKIVSGGNLALYLLRAITTRTE